MLILPVTGRTDVIAEWSGLALQAIRNESSTPPLAARNLAIVHIAIYDAVNSIEQGNEPYLLDSSELFDASLTAAAVSAAYWSLSFLYPSHEALFDDAFDRYLAETPANMARENGINIGAEAAFTILGWRDSDGSSTTVPYIPLFDPGAWQRTPPTFRPPELPQWPYVTPFVMTDGGQFRPDGPPSLSSTQYTRDFLLTKILGGLDSTNRTAEQTLIARFWSDFSFTVTPPGHWNQIAQNVATNHGNTLAQNARLFALLNIAMADAGIVSWDAKYAYNFWRPVTAIREADTDGNPDTEIGPSWTPLLNTPPFPEYTSGHSTFSGAAAAILAAFYGTDHIPFTVGSDTVSGVLRCYDSFEAAAEEIGMSRIYGGIHFLSADLDGLEAGREVGEFVFHNVLRPTSARLSVDSGSDGRSLRISVTGVRNKSYSLESSTDMLTWEPVLTNSAPFTLEVALQSEVSLARFYRAVETSR